MDKSEGKCGLRSFCYVFFLILFIAAIDDKMRKMKLLRKSVLGAKYENWKLLLMDMITARTNTNAKDVTDEIWNAFVVFALVLLPSFFTWYVLVCGLLSFILCLPNRNMLCVVAFTVKRGENSNGGLRRIYHFLKMFV